jgi:hypothetical protein
VRHQWILRHRWPVRPLADFGFHIGHARVLGRRTFSYWCASLLYIGIVISSGNQGRELLNTSDAAFPTRDAKDEDSRFNSSTRPSQGNVSAWIECCQSESDGKGTPRPGFFQSITCEWQFTGDDGISYTALAAPMSGLSGYRRGFSFLRHPEWMRSPAPATSFSTFWEQASHKTLVIPRPLCLYALHCFIRLAVDILT